MQGSNDTSSASRRAEEASVYLTVTMPPSEGFKMKLSVSAAMGLIWFITCSAPVRAEVPVVLRACVKITNNSDRLACFDKEVARLSDPAGTAYMAPATPRLSPEEKMGLSERRVQQLESSGPNPTGPRTELQVHISRVSTGGSGRTVFELDDGQVWQQVEPNPHFVASAGTAVTIAPGAFGSFWLSSGKHQSTKVKRLS